MRRGARRAALRAVMATPARVRGRMAVRGMLAVRVPVAQRHALGMAVGMRCRGIAGGGAGASGRGQEGRTRQAGRQRERKRTQPRGGAAGRGTINQA